MPRLENGIVILQKNPIIDAQVVRLCLNDITHVISKKWDRLAALVPPYQDTFPYILF